MAWKYSHRRAAPFFSNETKMSCWHGVFRSFSHAKSKVTKKKKKVRISAATVTAWRGAPGRHKQSNPCTHERPPLIYA